MGFGISLKNKYPPHTDVMVLAPAHHTVIVFKEYARMLTGYITNANPYNTKPDNNITIFSRFSPVFIGQDMRCKSPNVTISRCVSSGCVSHVGSFKRLFPIVDSNSHTVQRKSMYIYFNKNE